MITIKWVDFPITVSDAGVKDFIEAIVERSKSINDFSVEIGQEIVFDAIRLAIREERIDFKNILFVFGNEVLEPNKFGHLKYYPTVLFEHNIIVRKLIGWNFDIRNTRGD